MSLFVADPATEDRPAGLMLFRCGLILFAVACTPIVFRGVAALWDDDSVRSVAVGFLRAVSAGRKADALGYLSDEYRDQVAADWQPGFDQVWQPTENVSVQILSVVMQDDTAAVRVSVSKDGYAIRPVIHCQRNASDEWRITRLEGVAIDPRWQRFQAQAADESLADELTKLFEPAISAELSAGETE